MKTKTKVILEIVGTVIITAAAKVWHAVRKSGKGEA